MMRQYATLTRLNASIHPKETETDRDTERGQHRDRQRYREGTAQRETARPRVREEEGQKDIMERRDLKELNKTLRKAEEGGDIRVGLGVVRSVSYSERHDHLHGFNLGERLSLGDGLPIANEISHNSTIDL